MKQLNKKEDKTYYKEPFFGTIEKVSTGEKRLSNFIGAVKSSSIPDPTIDPTIDPIIRTTTDPIGDPSPESPGDNGDDDPTPIVENVLPNILVSWGEEQDDLDMDQFYSVSRIGTDSWENRKRTNESIVDTDFDAFLQQTAYTDKSGNVHIAYHAEDSLIKYAMFSPSTGWSMPITIHENADTAYAGEQYLNIVEYNSEVYVFYYRWISSDGWYLPALWRKSTETSEIYSFKTEFPGFGIFAESGNNCFYVNRRENKVYFAWNDFNLCIATAYIPQDAEYLSIKNLNWTILNFATSPLNTSSYINNLDIDSAENLCFAEDPNGIVHLVYWTDDLPDNEEGICRFSSNTWGTVSEEEILYSTPGFWPDNAINYIITDNGVHHIVYSGPRGSEKLEFNGYANVFETVFDELNPLDQWTVRNMREIEGDFFYSSSIVEDPDTGMTRTIVNDGGEDRLNLYYECNSIIFKNGRLEWDAPGSYTDVIVTMEADMRFRGTGGRVGIYLNGNQESSWKDFEGYIITFEKPNSPWSGPIQIHKKWQGYTGTLRFGGPTYMGGISHPLEPLTGTIVVRLEQRGAFNMLVVTYEGLFSRVVWDQNNPIRNGISNQYGIYWETGRALGNEIVSGVPIDVLDINIYNFKLENGPQYTGPTDFDEGIWHLTDESGLWKTEQIVVDDEANYPFTIKNGNKIHTTWMDSIGDIYAARYEDSSWNNVIVYDGEYSVNSYSSLIAKYRR